MSSQEDVHHIPYAVVPLLGIIGAAALIMICWVLYRHAHQVEETHLPISDEQAIYMREVRQRNRADIEALTGYYRTRRASRQWRGESWWSASTPAPAPSKGTVEYVS